MTYTSILKFLEAYKLTNLGFMPGADLKELDALIDEVKAVQDRDSDKDIWKDECFLIPAFIADQVMNELTYDIYGKLYIANGGQVTREQYAEAIHNDVMYESMPDSMIELGYDIIYDLYSDNEMMGCHKPDGTFDCSK